MHIKRIDFSAFLVLHIRLLTHKHGKKRSKIPIFINLHYLGCQLIVVHLDFFKRHTPWKIFLLLRMFAHFWWFYMECYAFEQIESFKLCESKKGNGLISQWNLFIFCYDTAISLKYQIYKLKVTYVY